METYFSEGLTKWRDLNLTVHFSRFSSVASWLVMRTKKLLVSQSATIVEFVKLLFFFCSHFSERGFQQEPVIQHAGFSSKSNSRESENTPVCQGQLGLPAITWVSWFCFFLYLYVVFKQWHRSAVQLPVNGITTLSLVLNLSFVPQPGGAAGQRSADWLLPPLSWFLPFDHLAAGHQGHRAAGVGVHLPLISLQVPVAAHGERHEQYLQVKKHQWVKPSQSIGSRILKFYK